MAVQAQYPDFRARIPIFNELNALQERGDSCALKSELTSRFSKKRSLEVDDGEEGEESAMAYYNQQQYLRYQIPNLVRSVPNPSTSGRIFPSDHDLQAQIYNHNVEMDALIRFQNERLRLGLEEERKRQCRSLISALEQRAIQKLKEKDEELATANRKNAELEEQIRQISAENEIWFTVAKNSEAIVATLKASLEQVLANGNGAVKLEEEEEKEKEEGFGDSEGTAFVTAEDAGSCCFGGKEESNGAVRRCKVCGERDASVLLLPCRHLCLCKDCEPVTDTCPVCQFGKNFGLQVYLS